MVVREEEDKGSQTFFIPITFHHCTENSYSSGSQHYEFNFVGSKGWGMGVNLPLNSGVLKRAMGNATSPSFL